ncbi:MAG TPA: FliA/WhiG family RNA polymerase sigma factor [Gemmatimonadaceae bacterium]|nr:FliA/WhiG family RNA polymerase sigma factor [Gemmatimonadaceae bacterium]
MPRSFAAYRQRDALLEQHIGLVHHVARLLANRLSTEAELDELVSAGTLGLLHAAEQFDAGRGLSFSTYAVPRIRGAILDELRRLDHVPRNVRRRSRELGRARDALSSRLRRSPTYAEVAHVLGVAEESVLRWELDAEAAAPRSLDQPARGESVGATLADTIADDNEVSFDEALAQEQEVTELKRAVARLKEQERVVLALNYFEGLKLQEIARVLGLSVCRISQIRTAALAKLRTTLAPMYAA